METHASRPVAAFDYARPASLDEAFRLLERHAPRAYLLAGGTDLLVQIRARRIAPTVVVDLKRVKELSADIVESESALEIGALTLLSDIIKDARVRRYAPVLAEAAATVGSVQIRNRATLPGNVCNASPAADTVPGLLVHEAVVNLAGPRGARRLPITELLLGPGKTARRPDEIVTSITLPKQSGATGAAFVRLTRRHGVDLATINVCCLLTASGRARFAFGAVAPTVVLAEDASGRLGDPALPNAERERLLRALLERTSPISDVRASREYRAAMLLVLGGRALAEAIKRLAAVRHGG